LVIAKRLNSMPNPPLFSSLAKSLPAAPNRLGQMKRALTFLNGRVQSGPHDAEIGVIGEFEVVDTGHDAGEVVVGGQGRFTWLAHYCEHWGKTLESWNGC
jgi:hypothetical protein